MARSSPRFPARWASTPWLLGACAVAALLLAGAAPAARIAGQALDPAGQPVPFVRIHLANGVAVPATVTVFTASDGRFASPPLAGEPGGYRIEAFRIGWEESERRVETRGDDLVVELSMRPLANVAEQVPASAWVPGKPGERNYHTAVHECSNCHQFGAERVKRFARRLAGASEEARTLAWEGIVQFMRTLAFTLGPTGQAELRWGLTPEDPDYQAALVPETSFFTPRDMDLVIPLLAAAFPTDFDEYTDYRDTDRLGDYGVTGDTFIEEYVLPSFGWTREVAVAPGSDQIWFVELDADRIGSLDPEDGSVRWYPVPGEGPQGPHTLNADSRGNLWIALEESYGLARFDTRDKSWRVYPPPEGVKFAITHDAAFNAKRHVEPDAEGRIWLTLIGINELWSIQVDSGEVRRYPLPIPEGEQAFHVFLYGAALDPNGKRVWYTQLHGHLGAFNTETEEVEKIVPFPQGAAPRRMAIQEDGTLWVPLFGEGQLLKFDTARGVEAARYDLPDRGAASYSVTYDGRREAVWVGTTNSDRIYRFDIETERWSHYPLPRKEAYIRMIEVDLETGDLWTTYSNLPVGKRDPAVHGTESANNMLVRLHPGD